MLLSGAYLVGSIAASSALFLLWSALGGLLDSWMRIPMPVIGILALVALMHDLNVVRIWYPQRHWQVPVTWVQSHGVMHALTWSITLGFGLFTYNPYATFYVGIAVALRVHSLFTGLGLALAYGLGRSLPIIVALWHPSLSRTAFLPYLRSAGLWTKTFVLFSLVIAIFSMK